MKANFDKVLADWPGSNDDFLVLLGKMIHRMKVNINDLKKSIDENSLDGIAFFAHKTKFTSSFLGDSESVGLSNEIKEAHTEGNSTEMKILGEKLANSIESCRDSIFEKFPVLAS